MAARGEKTCYLTDSINEGADGPFVFMDVPDYSWMPPVTVLMDIPAYMLGFPCLFAELYLQQSTHTHQDKVKTISRKPRNEIPIDLNMVHAQEKHFAKH
jgi:hypothetical protein